MKDNKKDYVSENMEYVLAVLNRLNLNIVKNQDGTLDIVNMSTGEVYQKQTEQLEPYPDYTKYTSKNSPHEILLVNDGVVLNNFLGLQHGAMVFGKYKKNGTCLSIPSDADKHQIRFEYNKKNEPIRIVVTTDQSSYNEMLITIKEDGIVYGNSEGNRILKPTTISFDEFTDEKCLDIINEGIKSSYNELNPDYFTRETQQALAYYTPLLKLCIRDFRQKLLAITSSDQDEYGGYSMPGSPVIKR